MKEDGDLVQTLLAEAEALKPAGGYARTEVAERYAALFRRAAQNLSALPAARAARGREAQGRDGVMDETKIDQAQIDRLAPAITSAVHAAYGEQREFILVTVDEDAKIAMLSSLPLEGAKMVLALLLEIINEPTASGKVVVELARKARN